MTDEARMRALLAEAPDVPDELRRAPLTSIKVRARRRRLATMATMAVALVTTTGVAVTVAALAGPAATPSPMGGVPSASESARAAVPWRVAMVDRTGTRLTLVADQQRSCSDATWSATAQAVTVTVAGGCEPWNVKPPTVLVTLPQPLGNRQVIDGWDGSERPVLIGSTVPEPGYPSGLTPVVSTTWSGIDGFVWSYARPGGPDVSLLVEAGWPDRTQQPDAKHYVAGREALIYRIGPGQGGSYHHLAVWNSGEWTYTVRVTPTEGGATDLGTVYAVLDGLIWR